MDPEKLWLDQARPRLGRPPAHSRVQVVTQAVEIADGEGLPAVTMRRVAQGLGTGVMTLYTYVPDKETLIELMLDQVGGEIRLTDPTGDWRADVRLLCHSQRTVVRHHPWLPGAYPLRRTIGPNTLAYMEHSLAILEPTGLDGRSRLEIIALLTGFVGNYVLLELTQERSGATPEEFAEAQARYLAKVLAAGEHPRLARLFAEPDTSPPVTFDSLLDRMIDGLVR